MRRRSSLEMRFADELCEACGAVVVVIHADSASGTDWNICGSPDDVETAVRWLISNQLMHETSARLVRGDGATARLRAGIGP